MARLQPTTDPYRVLGLLRGATPAQVKAAHRRLAKRFHPDGSTGDERALPGRAGGLPAAVRPGAAPRVGSGTRSGTGPCCQHPPAHDRRDASHPATRARLDADTPAPACGRTTVAHVVG